MRVTVSRRSVMTAIGVAVAAVSAGVTWNVRSCAPALRRRNAADGAAPAAVTYTDRNGWMLTPSDAQKLGPPTR